MVGKEEISQQQYDQAVAASRAGAATLAAAQAQAQAAVQHVSEARGKLSQAEAQLRSAETAPQQVSATRSRALAAEAAVQVAKAAVQQAQLNLQYSTITAPVSGLVGKKTVEVGQNVQPGQELMAIVPLDDIWVTANFKETQLRNMRPGQRVMIDVDSCGREYSGHVESIAGNRHHSDNPLDCDVAQHPRGDVPGSAQRSRFAHQPQRERRGDNIAEYRNLTIFSLPRRH